MMVSETCPDPDLRSWAHRQQPPAPWGVRDLFVACVRDLHVMRRCAKEPLAMLQNLPCA